MSAKPRLGGPAASAYQPAIERRLATWQAADAGRRLWAPDPTFWPAAPPSDVTSRMGWIRLPEEMPREVAELVRFSDGVRADGLRHVVLLGMGGSSLAPDVLRRTFGSRSGSPELIVLDSTHPGAISAVAARVDPRRTLFLVSSKSGTTTEPLDLHRYFESVVRAAGADPAPRFAAVTDPGSPLETLAKTEQFRAVFRATPTVGGRYSALTDFGLVPAALLGVDVAGLLAGARAMATRCGPTVPSADNPGLVLGASIGELAVAGRDKLTILAGPGWEAFGIWAEQLIAESTGKIGKGIVPVVNEPFLPADQYGNDRQFVALLPPGAGSTPVALHADALEAAGHPVLRVPVGAVATLGGEFLRWEIAVAVAGTIVGIDPFDQPDVELAKQLAREAMQPAAGAAPAPPVPAVRASDAAGLGRAVAEWSNRRRPGDYVAIQAYLDPNPETARALDELTATVLTRFRLATTLGFGPRFLHSTGQLHKGGPNTGLFLQIVDDPAGDVSVPTRGYTFGQLIHAQSIGDYRALVSKGRRVLRVQLDQAVLEGLRRLTELVRG